MLCSSCAKEPLIMAVNTPDNHEENNHGYTLYKRRWFMLAVVVMFNISNAMVWISFAPITNYAASYFDTSDAAVNWFSLVYFIVFPFFSVLSWWAIETLGFRFSVIAGTSLNATGALIRILGTLVTSNPDTRFTLVMTGQVICGCTQPLVLSMPTKLAALWFGDQERTIANTIASMANPLGVLIANAFATVIVKKSDDIKILLIIYGVPSLVAALMAIFGFWSSKPPSPPSASSLVEPVSFFTGIKEISRSKPFLLLTLASGSGIGAFSAISTLLQQMICVKGYDDTIASIAGALIIVGGFIGAGITGVYIDKTRNYVNLSKILTLMLCFSTGLIVIFTNIRNQTPVVLITFALFGFCALGALPVFLELGVECTYPVDEATSSGIQWMTGQVLGALMMVGSMTAAPTLTHLQARDSACLINGVDTNPRNFSYPVVIMVVFSTICALLFVMFFDTEFKRLAVENAIIDGREDVTIFPNGEGSYHSTSSS